MRPLYKNENTIRKSLKESLRRLLRESDSEERIAYENLKKAIEDMQNILSTEYDGPDATNCYELLMHVEDELREFFSDEDTGKLKWLPAGYGYDALA